MAILSFFLDKNANLFRNLHTTTVKRIEVVHFHNRLIYIHIILKLGIILID